MKLSKIKLNEQNPRIIKDAKFKQLVESLTNFPKMMRLRPIIVNKDYIIIGGNMRYRACVELGMKEIPDDWVQVADELTPDEEKIFVIEDNIQFGDWDWDVLANEWDQQQLIDLGLDYPSFLVADVPRPDFNETDLDKGKEINGKDGNWFYIEYYGQDELFQSLLAAMQDAGLMLTEHQVKPDVFMEAMKDWAANKQLK
jgi:hypothetical protein